MLILFVPVLAAPTGRGLWMHVNAGDPLGTDAVVGNPAAESLALARMGLWDVGRVYGGYDDRPVTERATVAAWNSQLDASGVDSQLLLGSAIHLFPGAACRGELLDQIDARLRDFHLAPPALAPDERFDALHLDIEPHQFKPANHPSPPGCADTALYWENATRAPLFALLHETLVEVRDHLDANGLADVPVYADLPFWVDTSPAFDWTGTPYLNGIDWTAQAATVTDGFSYLTYENDDAMAIRDDLIGERMLLLSSTPIRASLNARERALFSTSLHTWTYQSDLFGVAADLEAGTGLFAYDVDLHNYRYLAAPWPLPGLTATPVGVAAAELLTLTGPGFGREVVTRDGPGRLRPASLEAKLDRMRAVTDGFACTSPLDELHGGGASLPGGTGWSVDGQQVSTFSVREGRLDGALAGDVLQTDTSQVRPDGRGFAEVQGGFALGWYVRVAGREGIWFAGVSRCEADVDIDAVRTAFLR